MAAIEIKDLEMNEELDKKALSNLLGGRWVQRTYVRRVIQRYTRRVTQRIAVVSYRYRTMYQSYTRVAYQRYSRMGLGIILNQGIISR